MFGQGSQVKSGAGVAAGKVGGEAYMARCRRMFAGQPKTT